MMRSNIHNLDLDGDGLTACSGDCNDTDPAVGKIKLYEDLDGDGRGLSSIGYSRAKARRVCRRENL